MNWLQAQRNPAHLISTAAPKYSMCVCFHFPYCFFISYHLAFLLSVPLILRSFFFLRSFSFTSLWPCSLSQSESRTNSRSPAKQHTTIYLYSQYLFTVSTLVFSFCAVTAHLSLRSGPQLQDWYSRWTLAWYKSLTQCFLPHQFSLP